SDRGSGFLRAIFSLRAYAWSIRFPRNALMLFVYTFDVIFELAPALAQGRHPSSVSVRKHFESFESFVIQSGDLIREGHHRCGRRRTADVTTAANCDIRVT